MREKLAKRIAKSMLENPRIINMLRDSFKKRHRETKKALILRKAGKTIINLPTDKELKEKFARAIAHESYKMADQVIKNIEKGNESD